MPIEPGRSLTKAVLSETRLFVSLIRRALLVSEDLRNALATIDRQDDDIKTLKEAVRALESKSELQAARLESIAVRASADTTGELSRRLGFLEGRASRD